MSDFEYNEYLSDSYRKAQAEMGIDVVLREQLRVIGAKSWTEMHDTERSRLIKELRRTWIKTNKGKENEK